MDELSDPAKRLVRQQIIEEFLDSCGDDCVKKRVIEELAGRVLGKWTKTISKQTQKTPQRPHGILSDEILRRDFDRMISNFSSPYRADDNAENGIDIFEDFKLLLEPQEEPESSSRCGGRSMKPSPEIEKLLGKELATSIVKARQYICFSGSIYSADWKKGVVRDKDCGNIPKLLILACMREDRFYRAELKLLDDIADQLDLTMAVKEALPYWGVEGQYPLLAGSEAPVLNGYQRSHRKLARLCQIFLARAFICMKTLDGSNRKRNLNSKMMECLELLEKSLQVRMISNSPSNAPIGHRSPRVKQVADFIQAKQRSPDNKGTTLIVEQVDPITGKVMGRFSSIPEANENLLVDRSAKGIYHVLAGRAKSAHGYKWRRVAVENPVNNSLEYCSGDSSSVFSTMSTTDSVNNIHDGIHRQSGYEYAVEQLSLTTGEVLAEYETVMQAFDAMRTGRKKIMECLRGNRDQAVGFFWRKKGSKKSPASVREKLGIALNSENIFRAQFDEGKHSNKTPPLERKMSSQQMRPRLLQPVDARTSSQDEDYLGRSTLDDDDVVPVEKIDAKTGELVSTYNSARKAARENGLGVYGVISGQRNKYKGHLYRYKVDLKRPAPEQKGSPLKRTKFEEEFSNAEQLIEQPIERVSLVNGEVIEVYTSLNECGRALDLTHLHGIKRVLCGEKKNYLGFFWRIQDSTTMVAKTKFKKDDPVVSTMSRWQTISPKAPFNGMPYSDESKFELHEALFDRLQHVLQPSTVNGRRILPSFEAEELFGDFAKAVVISHHYINLAGLGFSKSWLSGTIHDVNCGILPERTLLLCLHAKRLQSSSKNTVAGLVMELNLKKVVDEAVHAWGLQDLYTDAINKSLHPQRSKLKVNQCYVFIGRVWCTMNVLGYNDINDSLTSKVLGCLEVIRKEFLGTQEANDSRGAGNSNEADKLQKNGDDQAKTSTSSSEPTCQPGNQITEALPLLHLQPSASMIVYAASGVIGNSPYAKKSIETGEEMFEAFKRLLELNDSNGRRGNSAKAQAIDLFGESLANTMVRARAGIIQSGIMYGSEWTEGRIRGATLGAIPSNILLLLLPDWRFSKAGSHALLTKIIVDLNIFEYVKDALREWDLIEQFPFVEKSSTHVDFVSRKVLCMKCIIFIARALCCMKLMKLKRLSNSAMTKAKACFQILNVCTRSEAATMTQNRMPLELENSFALNVDDESSTEHGTTSRQNDTPTRITENSHVLFQLQIGSPCRSQVGSSLLRNSSVTDNMTKPKHRDEEKQFTTKFGPGQNLLKTSANGGYWFPLDPHEFILNQNEIEMAWLAEESIYCLRKREIQWNFVWKYASPTLKIELRQTRDDQNVLQELVRLSDSLVSKRYAMLRREIRRKLHRGFVRERMLLAVPKFRRRRSS